MCDAGKLNEKVQPPDAGYGFFWRLDTCWRFEERDGGAYAECRAISLTRDIPSVLKGSSHPWCGACRRTRCHTLKATRDAVARVPA